MSNTAIDAVVTWVDGADPKLSAKRALYAEQTQARSGIEDTRFADQGEIEHCLTSLLRFAPWFRKIYVVSDAQVPNIVEMLWAADPALRARLIIVDHQEIFAALPDCLPSFNSLAIETVLYRIPGLAPRFVVFNDDFMLLRPVDEADFFGPMGPVLRGKWMSQMLRFLPPLYNVIDRCLGRSVQRFSFKQVQLHSARLAGIKRRFYCSGHTPYPVVTATVADFFARFPDLERANAGRRFRHPDQFHMMVLANHLELVAGRAALRATHEEVFIRADVDRTSRIEQKLQRAETDTQTKFLCIGSLDLADPEARRKIKGWLDARI
jgi:hypothetical protein